MQIILFRYFPDIRDIYKCRNDILHGRSNPDLGKLSELALKYLRSVLEIFVKGNDYLKDPERIDTEILLK